MTDNPFDQDREDAVLGPSVDHRGGVYIVTWPQGVTAEVMRLRETRDGHLKGRLTMRHGAEGSDIIDRRRIVSGVDQNMSSTVTRRQLIKELQEKIPDDNLPGYTWGQIVEQMCSLVQDTYWQGEPVHTIGNGLQLPPRESGFLCSPYLRSGVSTMFYGKGGSTKSMIGARLALLVQAGVSEPGMTVQRQANVLVLDWETDAYDFNERVKAIKAGSEVLRDTDTAIGYRRCHRPLLDDISEIQRQVVDRDVGFIIIDSVGGALRGDFNDAAVAIEFFNAVRSLNVTALLIDHVAKGGTDPIGSVMKLNTARSTWEVQASEEDVGSSTRRVALFHRKVNTGKMLSPRGFKVVFQSDHQDEELQQVRFEPIEVSDVPDLAAGLPVKDQIVKYLRGQDNGRATLEDICTGLGLKPAAAKSALYRGRGVTFTSIDELGEWGLL